MSTEPAPPSWPAVLGRLTARRDLDEAQAAWAMESILRGEATSAQIAGFVTALRTKGETPEEVAGLVSVMLAHARLVDLGDPAPVVLDVVGTGGDQSHSVNISTMAALVCAAAGAVVVKHGNRAASSATGTADVLEELGVAIDLEPDGVAQTVRGAGIGFCFAQVHHPAMRFAGPTRRELGVPTVFNVLGPLTNPAGARAALIGCASAGLAPVMADVLARRGVRAVVVRGEDGLDEVSTAGPTRAWDATGGDVREVVLTPEGMGARTVPAALLRGGDRARNAALLRATLGAGAPAADSEQVEAIREAVAVNAAAALVAHAAAVAAGDGGAPATEGLESRIAARLGEARDVVASGDALALLDRWAALSRTLTA